MRSARRLTGLRLFRFRQIRVLAPEGVLTRRPGGNEKDSFPASRDQDDNVRGARIPAFAGMTGGIWDHARTQCFTIVSKNTDLRERSFVEGFPPSFCLRGVGKDWQLGGPPWGRGEFPEDSGKSDQG